MFRLFSLSCELRRWLAGALLSFPLTALAAAPQETFLPPQQIPLPGTMTFGKLVVADVNGDGYDDIVIIGTDIVDKAPSAVIDIYVNDATPKSSVDDVTFVKQRLVLKTHDNADASMDKVRFSGGFDLQVTDLDNDGKPDILASVAASGEIFVLWNQGKNAPAPYAFVPDKSDPNASSMAFFSPLSMDGVFGTAAGSVLGTPVYVVAADLKDGSGRKSIVAYHASLQPDLSSAQPAPFDQRNYEAMAIIYPVGSGRGFDIVTQRAAWPGCDLSFGSACPGWSDGMSTGASLYNFRIADQLRLEFDSAASDILATDSSTTDGANRFYTPAVIRPNASPGLQLLGAQGSNGSDAIWLQGGGQVHEFVVDNALKLMRQRTAIDAVVGNERAAGATFGFLSTGQAALITGAGMKVAYDPSDAGSAVTQPMPEYLNRSGQVGAWLEWASLGSGSALLSLADYCRAPDPCAKALSWYHTSLDGSVPPAFRWGDSPTLLMLDFAQETAGPSGKHFKPFFDNVDDGRFQAFSLSGGSLNHKPFIAAGHFASPTEPALILLDHANGNPGDPLWNHLMLYRSDVGKTYHSPVPKLSGFVIGDFIRDHMVVPVGSFQKGEKSVLVVGSNFGMTTKDALRYAVVRDSASRGVKGMFPLNPVEWIKDEGPSGSTLLEGASVPGLSTLPIGAYDVQVRNATEASEWVPLGVGNPHGIVSTDYDWLAGKRCGLVPNTRDGKLWPKQIPLTTVGFAGDGNLQRVRWVKDDGTSVEVNAADYATFDASTNKIALTVPQSGALSDGVWRVFIEADGIWTEIPRAWNIASDAAALDACAAQVDFEFEEAYSQCTNHDYYLKPVDYASWPMHADGTFRFFGSGFASNRVASVAIKQNGTRYFATSFEVIGDHEVHVGFGDLSSKLLAGTSTDLYFYPEPRDVVEANGVPAVGGKLNWRTPRAGTCIPKMPEIGAFLNKGTGVDGTWQSGDVIHVNAKNALYPVPSATKLLLKGGDGSTYMLEDPQLPDDFYAHHYDNDNVELLFTVPENLESARLTTGSGGDTTTRYGTGLVVVEQRALATAAVSQDALALMLVETNAPLVFAGATAAGLAVYTGVIPQTWVAEKLQLLTKKITDTGYDVDLGHQLDNQPRRPEKLFYISFVSQPKIYDGEIGPFDCVIVKASSALEAMSKAKSAAIPDFMARTYFTFGEIVTVSSFPTIPSGGAAAAVVSIGEADPAGTNPRGLTVPMNIASYPWHFECGFLSPLNGIITAQGFGYKDETLRNSVIWRRSVLSFPAPPAVCGTHFVDEIGNAIAFYPGSYITTDKNDYTRF